jgi:hypothetical protein
VYLDVRSKGVCRGGSKDTRYALKRSRPSLTAHMYMRRQSVVVLRHWVWLGGTSVVFLVCYIPIL